MSTRNVDALVEALGGTGISKSEVSRICGQLDEDVGQFRTRRLDAIEYPYVFLDATYLHVRSNHLVTSKAVVVATEVAAYIDLHADQVDQHGHWLVVRNGSHAPRQVATAAGAVPVKAPRVNDRRVDEATGQRQRFASAILPAWARKSPQVAEVLPLLYLHGLSTGDFMPALEQFCGPVARRSHRVRQPEHGQRGLRVRVGRRVRRGLVGGDDHPADPVARRFD